MRSVLLTVSVLAACAASAEITLVPAPRELAPAAGVCRLRAPMPCPPWDWADYDTVGECLKKANCAVRRDATLPTEGYELTVGPDKVEIAAADDAGEFYARETLKQLTTKVSTDEVEVACCRIRDWPQYRWRGMMIDEARRFLGKSTVLRVLDLMAMHKLNVLHWHLVDDQGWRLELKRHPELVEYGAVRPCSVKMGAHAMWLPPKKQLSYVHDTEKYGPYFYTQEDVREILAHAKARHVTVVPEIELPGHVRALLASHPELSCKGDLPRIPRINWSIEQDVLCVGNDAVLRLLEEIFDEVCELFPETPFIHIGGDECPRVRWKECPKCQARMKAEGMKDESGLQAWIVSHFVRYLEKKGRRAVGWDEILAGDVPTSAVGMTWRSSAKGGAGTSYVSAAEATARGHDMVMTPSALCYLSKRQFESGDPYPYYSRGKPLTLEEVYTFDPVAGIPEGARGHVIGGQASVWGESVFNVFDLEWKTWPRACAIAEILWTAPAARDFAAFRRRVARHRDRLVEAGVNAAPVAAASRRPLPDDRLLEALIRIPSVSADVAKVNEAVDFFRGELTAQGLVCRVETMPGGRRVLYAANVDGTVPDVLLSAHLDVVPAQSPDQFEPRRENGRIYGRGASDCKEHCVLAARLMRELKGKVSVGCVFGSDEEMGGASTVFMLEQGYAAKKLVVVMDSEQYAITTVQKGLAHYVVSKDVPAVHTGMVKGPVPNAVRDLTKGYFDLTGALPEHEDGSWRDIVSLVNVSGDSAHAELKLCLRVTDAASWTKYEELIRQKLGGTLTCLRKGDPVYVDERHPLLLDFRRRMRERWPERNVDFYRLNSSTDARHLQRLKLPMLIIGVDARGAHAKSEYVILQSMDEHAELIGRFLEDHFKASGSPEPQVKTDAEAFDFRLKPTSPALSLGFRPWDYAAGCAKE